MPKPTPLPDVFEYVPFSRQAALDAGLTDQRLRRNDLVAPFHGVRRHVDAPTDLPWECRAYGERMHPASAFSHITAARLYGLELPLYVAEDRSLHVSVSSQRRAPEGRGIVGHSVRADVWKTREVIFQDTQRGDLLVLHLVEPALLWVQLATVLDRWDLIAAGDAMVSGKSPLTSLDQLQAAVAATRGMRGAKLAAAVVGDIRCGPRSRPESIVRLQCLAAGLPEPTLNVVVHDRAGKEIWTPDLQWLAYLTLLEYQGDGHRSKGKFRMDVTRFEEYKDGGWHPMQAHGDDVFVDPNPLLARIARRLAAQGWVASRRNLRQVVAARR